MIVTLIDLTEKVSSKMNVDKQFAEKIVREFYEVLTEELAAGNDIVVRNQFSLRMVTRKARVGNDISRGERVQVPERKVVKFIPSTQLFKILSGL